VSAESDLKIRQRSTLVTHRSPVNPKCTQCGRRFGLLVGHMRLKAFAKRTVLFSKIAICMEIGVGKKIFKHKSGFFTWHSFR
jgi:hypothetical protein